MKTTLLVTAALAGMACASYATPINITLYDRITSGSGTPGTTWYNRDGVIPWTPMSEDQEVETGAALQSYDLEGMFYDRTTKALSLVGGFNFKDGGAHPSGDLFFGADPLYGDGVPAGEPDGSTIALNAGAFGYAYAYRFNFTDMQWELYKLAADTALLTATPGADSNPWKFVYDREDTKLIKTGKLVFQNGLTDAQVLAGFGYGYTGGNHKVLTLEDETYFGISGNTGHFTMECGNDALVGHGVPDGGLTIGLMGLAMLGLGAVSRRLRR